MRVISVGRNIFYRNKNRRGGKEKGVAPPADWTKKIKSIIGGTSVAQLTQSGGWLSAESQDAPISNKKSGHCRA